MSEGASSSTRRVGRNAVALFVSVAVIASTVLVSIAPAAVAADACSSALVGPTSILNGTTNSIKSWTEGLATIGKLAEPLPGVGASAGSVVGFTDLVDKFINEGTDNVTDAASCDPGTGDKSISLGAPDGRTGNVHWQFSNVTGGKQLDVTITAAKTLHDQALGIPVPIGGGSSAPQSGFSSQGGVDLTTTATLGFSLVWPSNGDPVYVVANSSTPSLRVDAAAHFAALTDIKAAIGILGVQVKSGSTLDLAAHFKGSVSDPNGDGKLEFTGGAAELSAPGSLAGLVSFGFDNPAGHLNAHLLLGAAASQNPAPIPLPAINATIDLDWTDLATPMPTPTVSGLDAAGAFLNMTPRDLADGIGQLVTSLTMVQRSNIGNLELPFMKGTLADAIQLNESLKKFLKDNTVDPNTDPAQAGHPTFVSLQQFFDRMTTVTVPGTSLTVSNVNFNETSKTVDFKVSIDRAAPASAIDLNAAAAASSGGPCSIYTATTLKDPNQHWKADEWKNRHVVAGTSGATVASNTTDTITFAVPTTPTVPGQAWSPTVPTNGSPYSISGMDGDVGVVALGDALKTSGKGVGQANAVNATAKVTPSYHAEITLVLDLQNPTHHDPPVDVNGDGSTLVSDTPTGADRVLLRTSNSELFHADFPMDAGIDLFANAGFLQVRLQGAMSVSKKSGAGHMLAVSLKNNGDLTFHDVVDKLLHHPGDLLNFDIGVAGAGSVTATVPGAPSFFPSAVSASFHWDDITTGTPQFDLSGLSKLTNVDFDPTNPKQLFSILLKTLQTLDQALGQGETTGTASIFSQKIPVVGRSLRDLLRADESGMGDTVTYGSDYVQDTSRVGSSAFPSSLAGRSIVVGTQVGIIKTVTSNRLTMFSDWKTAPTTGTAYVVRSELDDVISILQNNPSDNLQALVDVLNNRLGHDSPVVFKYDDGPAVGNVPSLVVKLDWKRNFHTSSPVQFDFTLPGLTDVQKLVGVQGKGQVSLGAGGHIKVGLVVPLAPGDGPADASALKILDDSSIGVNLDASVTSGTIATTIGPLSLSLGDPDSDSTQTVTAKANYSIDLAKAGSTGTATSFSSFFGAVAPSINTSNTPVTCGLPDETTSTMALCANLPLFISNNGGTSYEPLITSGTNNFAIRLPDTTTSTADLFSLSDSASQVDGHHRLETPDADALAAAIQSKLIDLTRIDGIDGFLNLLIQSLNAASFGGKLPLVGDDLQQGADFLSNLKETIDNAIGGLASVDSMGELRDWVNGQLHNGLHDAGLNPDTASIDTTCSTTLDSPTPTVTPNPAYTTGTAVTVTYAVVAYVMKSGQKLDAQPASASASATTATVDASHTNKVSWTAINDPNGTGAAAGYKVYRKVGGDFLFLIDLSGAAQHEYIDDNSPAPTAGSTPTNPSGPNPKFTDCGIQYLDSVQINLNVSQGNFSGDTLNCSTGNPCTSGTVPLDIGIPGLSLRAATPGDGPRYELGWRLHLAFGISRSQGFFVDTTNVGGEPEFAVGLNLQLPQKINAQLAFINISAENCTTSMTNDCDTAGVTTPTLPGFGGTFKIDLLAPNDPGGHHLTLSDLSGAELSDLFHVTLTAQVHIDWLLKARPGTDGPIAGFPGIQTELRMNWKWQDALVGANDSSGGNQPLTISFLKVAIDAGEVFSGIIGPVVNQIKFVTGPLDPVIKTLYAPIPVLSDLSHLVGGDDVTIISLAKAFSTLADGPDLTFVDTIAGVVNFINHIPTCTASCLIPIGSFDVAGQKAIDNAATPSNTESLIQTKKDTGGNAVTSLPSALGALDSASTGTAVNLVDEQAKGEAKAGFTFPVFQNPASLFNLILGGDVDLVKFDSGNLRLGFDWNQQFGPVYAPPPVFVTLHGSADVTLRIVAGFDTYGIRKAFEKVRDTGEFNFDTFGNVFLQSLFFYTTDQDGKPLPVVSFHGEIAAGAAVSAVIITVGIEGGVSLTISFLWNDPNHDGKFRISEFLQAALNNPICLFSVSGKISVFLRAYVTIGFSPFSVSFSFTIVDVTLLDFSATPDCTPPPPKLGGVTSDGTTLVVYAGALAHGTHKLRGAGDTYDADKQDNDTIKVTSLHDYTTPTAPSFRGIAVEMLGIRREFLNANIQRVMVLGTIPGTSDSYSKPMIVTFLGDGKEDTTTGTAKPPTANFDKTAIVFGGGGADKIKTGIGDSYVDGRGGDDVISTSDDTVLNAGQTAYVQNAKAIVAGGLGNDSIAVGNGNDTVAGDDAITPPATTTTVLNELGDAESGNPNVAGPSVSVPDWTTLDQAGAMPTVASTDIDGTDTINAGLGQNNLYGNGGDDTIGIGADNALAGSKCSPAPAACLFRSAGNTIVGGWGNDHIAGGSGNDFIYTGDKTVTTFDSDGGKDYSTTPTTNTVDTGIGSDTVYGSKGVDIVAGHSVPPHSPATTDTIYGGSANDILVGGYGPDSIFGGPGDDYVIAEPSNVDTAHPGTPQGFGPEYTVTHIAAPAGSTPQPKTLVGGDGNDHIIGGDGSSNIDGDRYNDQSTDAHSRCIPGTERNPVQPVASDPVDESVNLGTDGNDLIIGGAGIDNVRAGGGNDTVDVKGSTDRVCGESGVDTIHGGADNDEVWGGTGGDTIYGDAGADKLYGNADNDTIYGGDQADQIEGNNGADWAFGGNDADVIVGGTRLAGRNDVGDHLFGDVGSDILIGDNGVDGGSPSGATVYDLTDGNCAAPDNPCDHGGSDTIYGGDGTDKAYGGLDNDHVFGGTAFDYIEGNPGADDLNGEIGEDDILGGTSQVSTGTALSIVGFADTTDTINGGLGEDVILGDNGAISRPGVNSGSDFTQARNMTERLVIVYDWVNTDATKFGGDIINGNEENDVVLGEGGADTIHGNAGNDYLEGNQDADSVYGDEGQDDILGGSSQVANGAPKSGVTVDGELDTGDSVLSGGDGEDVILGDNGFVLTTGTVGETFLGTLEDMTKGHTGMVARRINLYDVKDSPAASTSGGDYITGGNEDDVVFAQGGEDRVKGDGGDDHLEGGQASDFVEGDGGDDDIVGGTAVILTTATAATDAAGGVKDVADVLFGGDGNDVVSGDNAVIDRVQVTTPTLHDGANYTTKFTDRLNSDGSAIVTTRWFRRLDLRNGATYVTPPDAGRFGGDQISGGSGVDMLFGQDGNDFISGGPDDDYAEGNGGSDSIRGDAYLGVAAPTNVFPPAYPSTSDTVVSETTTPTTLTASWPGASGTPTELEGVMSAPDGQDDLIGGSTIQAFRDGNDTIQGDGEADFELGDNGALVRTYGIRDIDTGIRRYDVYATRYPTGAVPANAVVQRKGDPTLGMTSTRFCTTSQATCEVSGASGADTMYGDGGDDTQWGQDGNDTMRGGTGRDDMYGELGDDTMYGDAGEDAMLGDRGGIVDTYVNGTSADDAKFTSYTVSQNQPPAVSYTAFRPGTFDRRVDLYHDVNGDAFVGSGSTAKMAHDGITEGGDDRIRGGGGHDSIHAGFGDDLANGDSGGDIVFGDRGGDVLWGGKGCDPNSAEDFDGTCTDPSTARGENDSYVDYLFGGQGGTSSASVNGASGSDILDWQPRGSYAGGCTPNPWPTVGGTKKNPTNLDPCSWFLMTNTYNDVGNGDPGAGSLDPTHGDNQTHSGIDWMYGGWDRDVLQADQADEGPNTGDRLLDWSGAYNLYSHCNASYGGFNDVRQLSPAMFTFIQQWGYGVGLGQVNADITTNGTSAYDEVALVYQADLNEHGVGKAYPSTPGHFDSPNACAY
jgi:Ca2+-binding RTX toxin-like protein